MLRATQHSGSGKPGTVQHETIPSRPVRKIRSMGDKFVQVLAEQHVYSQVPGSLEAEDGADT